MERRCLAIFATILAVIQCVLSDNVTITTNDLLWRAGTPFSLTCTGLENVDVQVDGASPSVRDGWYIAYGSSESDAVPFLYISTLTRKANSPTQSATVTCKLRNSGESKSINITVVDVQSTGASLNSSDFQNQTVECSVVADPVDLLSEGVLRWQWYRGNTLVTTNSTGYNASSTANSTILHISDPDEESAGRYTCQLDIQGTVLNDTVSLEMAPLVKTIVEPRPKVQDETASIKCVVYGEPTPSITWLRKPEDEGLAQPVDLSDDRFSVAPHIGIPDAALTIAQLKLTDRAYYICNATNALGFQKGQTLLKVKDKLAAVWPFLGICAEVSILCAVIFIFEKRRNKRLGEEKKFEKDSLVEHEKAETQHQEEHSADTDLELRQRSAAKSASSTSMA